MQTLAAADVEQIKKEFAAVDPGGHRTVRLSAVLQVLKEADDWSTEELEQLFKAAGGKNDEEVSIDHFIDWIMQTDEDDDAPMPGAIQDDSEEEEEISHPTLSKAQAQQAQRVSAHTKSVDLTTEITFQEWMMLSRLLELDADEAKSSFIHWEKMKRRVIRAEGQNQYLPDKRPTFEEMEADMDATVPLKSFLEEHGMKPKDLESVEHVENMLQKARQKLARGDSYMTYATHNAEELAISQVLWGLFQERKPVEKAWEVVDNGTVVLSGPSYRALQALREDPRELVDKVREANISPPLLASHAGRQGNREHCIWNVRQIVQKCQHDGTKFTDPSWNLIDSPANVLWVDGAKPGYDCTVAKPAGYKRITEIIAEPVLFKGGVRPADIIQGQIGTCFLLGALGALVAEDPENVHSCFMSYDVDVGVYGIRFYLDGEWYHTVIDDWMPVDEYGRLLFARSYDHDEMWVPLLEKAFCKLHSCYEMCDGGLPGEAVSVLFGGAVGKFNIAEKTRKDPSAASVYFETVFHVHAQGWVLSTSFTRSRVEGGVAAQGKCGEGVSDDGLVVGHVYSVLRVVAACGHKLICCRNPWGAGEWKGKWSDANKFGEWTDEMKAACDYKGGEDGTFWMSIEDFVATSAGIQYSRPLGIQWKQLSQYSRFQDKSMEATPLWSYKARSADEISLTKGLNVTVQKITPGWWVGSVDGKQGYFPGNYVRLNDRPVARFDLHTVERDPDEPEEMMTALVMLIQPLAHRQRRFYKRKQDGLNYKDTTYPRVMLVVTDPTGAVVLKKEGKLRQMSGDFPLRGGDGVYKVYVMCLEGGGTPFTVRAFLKGGSATLTEKFGAQLSEIKDFLS